MNKDEEHTQQEIMSSAHAQYVEGLNRYSFFRLHEHGLSEDIVQDAFIKTWSYLVKGGKILVMKSFLYHILNNLIVDEYRKNKPLSLESLTEKGFDPPDIKSERDMNISDGNIAIELIKKLPLKYQKIIRMKYIQELTLQEMSLITGQTKNSLAVQIHRGLEKLRLLYKGAH